MLRAVGSLELDTIALLHGNRLLALCHSGYSLLGLTVNVYNATWPTTDGLGTAIEIAVDVNIHAGLAIMHMTAGENDVSFAEDLVYIGSNTVEYEFKT